MIQQLKLPTHIFDKVQNETYVTVNNTKLQVKNKFNLSKIKSDFELLKRKNNL